MINKIGKKMKKVGELDVQARHDLLKLHLPTFQLSNSRECATIDYCICFIS